MPRITKKVGLLGGTFDPIHKGHLYIAEQVIKKAHLDEVWLIPAGTPPHRNPPHFSSQDRLTMCKLAITAHPHLHLCDIEAKKTTPCYSIDTIKALQKTYPDITFYWIIGMDAFFKIESWHEWKTLLKAIHFLVVNRDEFGQPIELNSQWASLIPIPNCPISATKIREDFKAHEADLPEAVRDYIKERGLL